MSSSNVSGCPNDKSALVPYSCEWFGASFLPRRLAPIAPGNAAALDCRAGATSLNRNVTSHAPRNSKLPTCHNSGSTRIGGRAGFLARPWRSTAAIVSANLTSSHSRGKRKVSKFEAFVPALPCLLKLTLFLCFRLQLSLG